MRNHGAAAHKLGLKPKEAHSSFVSTKGNKFNTASTPAVVPLFETSDDWQLQFDITVKSYSQSKNAAFPSHIAATSCQPDSGLDRTHVAMGREYDEVALPKA